MTWARLDDAILDNPKIIRVGLVGFALHVAAITWCARNLTDGFIPEHKARSLMATTWAEEPGKSKYPPNPNRAGAQAGASGLLPEEEGEVLWSLNSGSGHAGREADETIDGVIRLLVRVGLWSEEFDDRGNFGYQLNDYCEYNPKRAEVLAERERKRAAGRAGGRRSGEARAQARAQAPASTVLAPVLPEESRNLHKQKATPVPVPVPTEEEPPTPFPDEPKPRDPLAYLSGGAPQQRPEVVQVFQTFCAAVGHPGRRMKAPGFECPDAAAIVEALATYGPEACLAVAREAPNDGMVNGSDDDKRQRHDSVRYVFGNPDAFARILRASQSKQTRSTRHGGKTIAEITAEAKALGGDL